MISKLLGLGWYFVQVAKFQHRSSDSSKVMAFSKSESLPAAIFDIFSEVARFQAIWTDYCRHWLPSCKI
jgi:hypothetical protein